MSIRKKRRKPSEYTKAVLALIDEYEAKTGDDSGDLHKAAQWLHDNGKFDPPKYDPVRMIAKKLATACRQDYIEDENGEPVRRRHAYTTKTGDNQKTFSWFKIEDATPEKMRLSAQGRRNGTLMDILQLVRDVDYFNKNYNPGDDIQVDANFTADIDELRMPAEYPDSPPEDTEEDDQSSLVS